METFALLIAFINVIIVAYALSRLYHSIFHVIYLGGIGAMFKEAGYTLIISIIIVWCIPEMIMEWGPTGQLIYQIVFFIVAVGLIGKTKKPGGSNSSTNAQE